MELFNEVKGYATRVNAIKALEQHVDKRTVRWFVAALPNGRFAPCVVHQPDRPDILALTHRGICIVG